MCIRYRMNVNRMLFYYVALTACITIQSLSVEAIYCHQCNSHLDENCATLQATNPLHKLDDQYLKECTGEHQVQAFCRKTLLQVEVSNEVRIVRSCGWLLERSQTTNNTCFSADNVGYTQTFCYCDTDGCNAAQPLANTFITLLALLSASFVCMFAT